MKTLVTPAATTAATLAAIMLLTACGSVPSDSTTPTAATAATTSSPAPAATAVTGTDSRPAPAQPSDKVVTTGKRKRVCESDEGTGSRLKRPRCYDLPDENEKAYREDILRDKEEELRQVNEANTLRTTNDVFAK